MSPPPRRDVPWGSGARGRQPALAVGQGWVSPSQGRAEAPCPSQGSQGIAALAAGAGPRVLGYGAFSLHGVRRSGPFWGVWVGRASPEEGWLDPKVSPWGAGRCCLVLEGLCGFKALLACPPLPRLLRSFGKWENNPQAASSQRSQAVPGDKPNPWRAWDQQNVAARNKIFSGRAKPGLASEQLLAAFCPLRPSDRGARAELRRCRG